MLRLLASVIAIQAVCLALPAQAATTVYGTSVYSQSGNVVNAGAALGAADLNDATLTRPAELVLNLGDPTSGLNLSINGLLVGNGSQLRVSLGAIGGGVAVFTATQNFPRNVIGPIVFDFSTGCAALSATGCTLIRFQMTGSPAGVFTLDGVSAVSGAPEPHIWVMMIIAFALAAWRLKAVRRRRALPAGRALPAEA